MFFREKNDIYRPVQKDSYLKKKDNFCSN